MSSDRRDTGQIPMMIVNVAPFQLEGYMLNNGWQKDGDLGRVATIWHRPEADRVDAEVILPLSTGAKDFRDRMIDAVTAIASFEGRPLVDVVKDTLGHHADLIRVRVIADDVDEGTIPINDGVLLNERARDLLVAAANGTLQKRKHFSGPQAKEAKEYIDSLRLGQTEIGSYVVNVIAPMKMIHVDQDALDPVPLAKIITATLASSLQALSSAARAFTNTADLSVFDEAVLQGASANMCDALVGLGGTDKKRSFEISIAPSRSGTFKSERQTFEFGIEEVSGIAAAASYYKENYVLENRTITGFIKRLDRPHGEQNGTVSITALLADVDKNISVELGAEDYDRAITAHKANDAVQCSGDIHVTPRTAKLLNPKGFRVVKTDDLF